ncbi:unnamed protein product [Oncorhynchus mykiss]|uniref:PI3K/PI4K catalytic domain-containing protein n=1 Tax=Oncorhynchus mykiss TaxID=8022 RepID=A0A060YR45_ONCMY|nr:unnamed protein product [Oncorhynchus mykiss]
MGSISLSLYSRWMYSQYGSISLSLYSKWMYSQYGVHFKQLKRLPSFSQILIPLQSVLIPTLPSTGPANTLHHNAFPGHWACLHGFDDTVEILASLQEPKKIGLKGSDGRSYTVMCKPKDDLRKDCRLRVQLPHQQAAISWGMSL